ncbi:hypothetical protein [Prevotella melaninogenica]
MKKRILLPVLCMAISIFTASCSSDDIESSETKEQMLTLTVSAGSEDDAAATRAVLSEADAAKSPWKWEQGDKILLVSGNGSQKTVSTLSLKSLKRGGLGADFEGQVPASSVTNGSTYRFFYVGKTSDGRSDRSVDASTGSINIDLTQQTGNLADLKRNCVLTGTGKVVVSGNKATTDGNVKLANVFAVAHFAVTANNNTALTKIGLRGKGVYASANVDLSTGAVTGVSEIGTEVDPEENIFFPAGTTDFYVTFVPGTVAPAFDGYYAGSHSNTEAITSTPEARDYAADKSFVYLNGQKAKFSVSATQKVAITNGNMQYVMPIATYTSAMNAKTLSANTLIRWKNSVPLKLKGTLTIHKGYYRLAPEQWEMAMPKNKRTGGSYSYSTIKINGKEYVSPETYGYFDLPSWGTIDNPTVINNTFSIRGTGTETQYDFGNKLYVGSKKTRVMTSDEWAYLMPQNTNNSNNRIWIENGKKYAKWARCFIDENGDGKRGTNPAELRGYLIFPDDMTIDDARKVFTKTPTFGGGNATNNPTTFEKIKSSGAVFIPLSAWRQSNHKDLKVWGEHGNYSTSSYKNNLMVHIRITATSSLFSDTSDPNQGCMSRLVQNL